MYGPCSALDADSFFSLPRPRRNVFLLRNMATKIRARRRLLLVLVLIVGVGLVVVGWNTGISIGTIWLHPTEAWAEQWHLNNFIMINAKMAYVVFGLLLLLFGGMFSGATLPIFFARKKTALATFFLAVILTAIGFNTLDYMLNGYFWNLGNVVMQPLPLPFVGASSILLDPWIIYFFWLIVPLWVGGFMVGFALVSGFMLPILCRLKWSK